MPPEMLDDGEEEGEVGFSSSDVSPSVLAVDIYAVGVILWELWMRQLPWKGKGVHNIVLLVGEKGKRPKFDMSSCPKGLLRDSNKDNKGKPVPPNAVTALISECWAQLFVHRPNITTVLETFDSKVVPAIEAAKALQAQAEVDMQKAAENAAQAAREKEAYEAQEAKEREAAAVADALAKVEKEAQEKAQQISLAHAAAEQEARAALKARVKADFEAKAASEANSAPYDANSRGSDEKAKEAAALGYAPSQTA
mmetsp:Transcript_64339/g.120658  ORF Transcript_64339/g.120658 Transcript_64339/m.120658 type:complete len:253 (-) Transcript_64339:83-841(-)